MTYALLDEGLTVTMVEKKLATRISATDPKYELYLQYLNGMHYDDSYSRKVKFQIHAVNESCSFMLHGVRTVEKLKLQVK